MPAGQAYTKEQADFILTHYRKDMKAQQIADHLGLTKRNVVKWMSYYRKNHPEIPSMIAKVGEQRKRWLKDRQCYVIKEKQADGSWKFAGYEGKVNKPLGHPIGFERKAKSGAIVRKTETGWKYIKKPRSEYKPRVDKIAPGSISTMMHRGRERQFVKQESGQWKILPDNTPKERKSRTKQVNPVVVSRIIKPAKTAPKRDKAKVSHSANPDKVKIPIQEGGQWVRLNNRTIVYRKHAIPA